MAVLLFFAYHDEREVRRVQTLAVGKQGRNLRVGFYGLQPRSPITRRGACVPLPDEQTERRGRPSSTYGHGSRGT